MLTIPHPTRIIVIHAHHSISNKNLQWLMLTTPHPTRIIVTHAHYSAGIHSGKRTFEKNKIKKKV
jgi:hypothetical protein